MSGLQYRDPVRAISGSTAFPGSYVHVSETGTSTLVPIYADPAQTVRLSNPLRADSAGRVPAIYCAAAAFYRVRVTDEAGNVHFTQNGIGGDLLPLALSYADPRDDNGALMPGASRTFYAARTTELETVYAEEALSTPLTNPVEADSSGEFPDVWLNVTREYRVRLEDQHGRLIYDVERLSFETAHLPPSAPVLSGEIAGTDIELDWTEAVSQFGVIAGYRLYDAATDTLIIDTEDPDDRDYTFGPIEEGNSYSFYVIAYDENGNDSVESNVVLFSVAVTIEIVTQSSTWFKPENLLSVEVTCIGGGGGGGGGGLEFIAAARGGGGGGGGGGMSRVVLAAGDVGSTETVTVGAAGEGGSGAVTVADGVSGGDGGSSSFGAHALASGGSGGSGGGGGGGVGNNGEGGSGGAGTSSNGGDGGNGGFSPTAPSSAGASSAQGGGGGGGGGGRTGTGPAPASGGGNGDTADEDNAGGAADAVGTSSMTSGGGGGGGGSTSPFNGGSYGQDSSPGRDGGTYGAGGGGGGGSTRSAGGGEVAANGGSGARGVIVLRYTYVT